MIARFLQFTREAARKIVRDQEIGGVSNYEDIAAESCAWAIETGVLSRWEVRGDEDSNTRRLREMARKSVFLRMMQTKRNADNPVDSALPFSIIVDDDGEGFHVIDESNPRNRSTHEDLQHRARRRREAPDVTEVEHAEQRQLLWQRWDQVLASLPENVRPCVNLLYREGNTYVEAADKLGLRPSTVRMRVERHRDSIRRQLGDEFLDLL